MRTHRTAVACAAMIGLCVAAPGPASAQRDPELADEKFQEARKFVELDDHDAACPLFAESHRLDPGFGTLMNLARCYEQIDKLATAWATYRRAHRFAIDNDQLDRARIAQEHADALEPRVPRLIITAPHADEIDDLQITRDDLPVAAELVDEPIYLDSGDYIVTARAPGHRKFSIVVNLAEAGSETVEIPRLEPIVKPAPPTPPSRTRRVFGLVLGGAGVVVLGVGLNDGRSAMRAWNTALDDGLCNRDTALCTHEGQRQTDQARNRASRSTVLVGAGLTFMATGALIYAIARKAERRKAERPVSARVVPVVGRDSLRGVAVTGRF